MRNATRRFAGPQIVATGGFVRPVRPRKAKTGLNSSERSFARSMAQILVRRRAMSYAARLQHLVVGSKDIECLLAPSCFAEQALAVPSSLIDGVLAAR